MEDYFLQMLQDGDPAGSPAKTRHLSPADPFKSLNADGPAGMPKRSVIER
jgi:hypothetical protein